MKNTRISRREAIGAAAGAVLAGCAVASARTEMVAPFTSGGVPPSTTSRESPSRGPVDPAREIRRAPGDQLVSSLEFEEQAQLVLDPDVFARIAGSDREPFNRITLHQQLGSPTLDMDLGVTLFGQSLFTPILLGPIAQMGMYHEEGETALVRGAGEAFTGVVLSSRASVPFERLAATTEHPLWYSVYAESGASEQASAAAGAGAGVIFITVGAVPGESTATEIDWGQVDAIRRGLTVPVVVKGIRTAGEARQALERGVQGVVVSNHGNEGAARPMEALQEIAALVDGRVPILIDGSFRRGSDVLKALAMGADAVLIGRPAAWALAAYGSDGVRWMLELMINELARSFAMLGVSRPDQLRPDHYRVHRWATA